MRTTILENGNLKLTLGDGDIDDLKDLKANNPDDFGCDNIMYEYFEEFISNSEYDWVSPEHIGALTDAPILATFGENDNDMGDRDVIDAYGFMDYCLISLQDQLLEYGEAVLIHG